MEISSIVFISSGLFLGWALGANHLGNVFGTAIGTRMVSFHAAALTCSLFIVIGAVVSGAGPAQTLGHLGEVNELAGAFMVALAAALTMLWMTRLGLPVSTTQAIVGGIVGWNLFSGHATDPSALTTIMLSWVAGPVIAAFVAVVLFKVVRRLLVRSRLHLLQADAITRIGLILAGALGAYSLGANNIANVMGVFVPVVPVRELNLFGSIALSSGQQLFLLGGLAIAAGIYTYSRKVVDTVGVHLLQLSPATALAVVLAHSLVMLMFSSQSLESLLNGLGLPGIPLVPISSSEVVVGAVVGIGILQGGGGIRWSVLGHIAAGWLLTPVMAALASFIGLYFLQNVFQQTVFH